MSKKGRRYGAARKEYATLLSKEVCGVLNWEFKRPKDFKVPLDSKLCLLALRIPPADAWSYARHLIFPCVFQHCFQHNFFKAFN